MEFFLVPLIAISVVTFGIYKLTALIFHIHLSGKLLLLLVVFAWMVSLVLPGLFFQTAGFLGSVGISLVSAVGFAWLATAVDSKRQSVGMTAVSTTGEPMPEVSLWTPPAESAAPVLPKQEWESTPAKADVLVYGEPILEAVELAAREQLEPVEAEIEPVVEAQPPEEIEPASAQEPTVELRSTVEPELIVQPNPAPIDIVPVSAEDSTDVSSVVEPPQPTMPDRISVQDVAVISDALLFEEFEADQENVQEPFGVIVEAATTEPVVVAEVPVMIDGPADDLVEQASAEETGEVTVQDLAPEPVPEQEEPQPASDSLDDLLEFAFSQRTRNNATGALVTFRLIRSLYTDSQALPMVIAEVVSTLQSQGDYPAAIMELREAIRLPEIQQDARLVRTFEQKRTYLQVLSALLNERGSPTLPFEQIPTEWHDDIEQGLLAGNRVQS